MTEPSVATAVSSLTTVAVASVVSPSTLIRSSESAVESVLVVALARSCSPWTIAFWSPRTGVATASTGGCVESTRASSSPTDPVANTLVRAPGSFRSMVVALVTGSSVIGVMSATSSVIASSAASGRVAVAGTIWPTSSLKATSSAVPSGMRFWSLTTSSAIAFVNIGAVRTVVAALTAEMSALAMASSSETIPDDAGTTSPSSTFRGNSAPFSVSVVARVSVGDSLAVAVVVVDRVVTWPSPTSESTTPTPPSAAGRMVAVTC